MEYVRPTCLARVFGANDNKFLNFLRHAEWKQALVELVLKTIEKGDLHTFTERRSRAEKKRTKLEKEFWTKPDPTIDAWMLVTGRKREVFDISSFVQRHRDIVPDLRRLRKVVNVHVLTTRCPVIAAVV